MPHTVLFVDDIPSVTDGLKRALHREPYRVLSANSAKKGLQIIEEQSVDVVVSDELMPGMSGSEFLAEVCRRHPDTVRIILTGHANLTAAVRAINEGQIYRFLTKPCNRADLVLTIRQAVQQKALLTASRKLLKMIRRQSAVLEDLEAENPGITKLDRDNDGAIRIEDVAREPEPLLDALNAEIKRSQRILQQQNG